MDLRSNKKSLSNLVYRDLKEKILKNQLLPGDKLIEMEIASKLGVSRTPVREALKKLEEDGLVTSFPRKSFIVSKISVKEAKNLYIVRKSLEPLAVELLAEKGFNEKTEYFQKVNEDLRVAIENKDEELAQNLIIEWNMALVSCLNNEILVEVMNMINQRLYRFGNFIFRDKKNYKKHYNNLQKIYKLIEEKKPNEARKASEKTIENIYLMFEEQADYKMFRI
ncbi:MAG: GntR family transcriptional regulator [Peptoniphilus harei]|uniref:Putative HTH-type transcriptional regulator YdfH n=1 Tax=Peptoniphilus gorbachii TaxID=411567 RepID=A0A6N2YWF1_9FIRM|nr:GntR family transcriptional regulator [uncultured Peptoniphilus sp.]MBS4882054.1 GntR family transcriptional regulator [Peptoniphilus harei]MBS5946063.1 GntR family transcriptional regulator [Peptoniphilus harei]MBS6720346.1 GntR family transcriptional regulator [Peptoniphilus harei]MDU1023447.1 GntR family transcriptional regulator [Peptoniphilus harei]MDU1583369.1 GntR family transcriptional regulator [Peptoniphilus harei]